MNHTIEKLEQNQVKIQVSISSEEFNVYKEAALIKLMATAEIKGFRKGKAPRNVYLRKYGEGEAIQNAMDDALNATYAEVIKGENIQVIESPKIDVDFEQFEKEKTFAYTATVAVFPEVELGKYFGLEVTQDPYDVRDDDIEKRIAGDLEKKADLELVEDGVLENGNTAIFDFEGFKDGVAFDGGKAENYSMVIGSGQFIPGFEEQMVGMKSGEEKTLDITFPENYHQEDLAGAAVEFKIKLHEIKKSVTPVLTDELVEELEYADVNTVEEYRAFIKEELEVSKKQDSDTKLVNDLLKMVIENAKVDIPNSLTHQRVHDMIHQEEHRAKSYGITFDQLLQMQGMTMDEYHNRITPVAESQLRSELVLNEIVIAEGITLTEEDYENGYQDYANENGVEIDVVKEQLPRDNVAYQFLLNKALQLIKENAIIKN